MLIIKHSNGNDVAFASDETAQAPSLRITSGGSNNLAGSGKSTSVSLSPNPASTTVAVSMKATDGTAVMNMVYVYDITGKLVDEVSTNQLGSFDSYQLDVNSLPGGVYFGKTYDQYGNEYQNKMLIER